jgi:hypothetical protein
MVMLASTLGFLMLLFIARALRRDSKVERESAGYFQNYCRGALCQSNRIKRRRIYPPRPILS